MGADQELCDSKLVRARDLIWEAVELLDICVSDSLHSCRVTQDREADSSQTCQLTSLILAKYIFSRLISSCCRTR